jgi:hypothetical protein
LAFLGGRGKPTGKIHPSDYVILVGDRKPLLEADGFLGEGAALTSNYA